MYDETKTSLASSLPRRLCPRAASFQAMTPKHMSEARRNTVTITVTTSNSRLHMSHGHRPSPTHHQSRGRSSAPFFSPHERAEPEPRTNGIGPGVSSFTVTSHHRPLTRGSRLPRKLENARPSGERNKEAFLGGYATCLTSGLKAAASA